MSQFITWGGESYSPNPVRAWTSRHFAFIMRGLGSRNPDSHTIQAQKSEATHMLYGDCSAAVHLHEEKSWWEVSFFFNLV